MFHTLRLSLQRKDEEKAPLDEEEEEYPPDGVAGAAAMLFNTEERMDANVAPARTVFMEKKAAQDYVSYHIPHDGNPGGSVASLPRYESPVWSPKDNNRAFSPDQSSPAGILLNVTPYGQSPDVGMSHESVRRDIPGDVNGANHLEAVGLGNALANNDVRGEPNTGNMHPDEMSDRVHLHPVFLPPLTDLGQLDKVRDRKHKKKKKRKHKERKDMDENENITINPTEDADQSPSIFVIPHDNDGNTQPRPERVLKHKKHKHTKQEGERMHDDLGETQQPEEKPDIDNETSGQFARHGSLFSNKVAPMTGDAIVGDDNTMEKKKKSKKPKRKKDNSDRSEERPDGEAEDGPATEPTGHDSLSASNPLAPMAVVEEASLTPDNDEQRTRKKKRKKHKHRENDMNTEDMPEQKENMNKGAETGTPNTEPPPQGSLVVFSSMLHEDGGHQEEGVQGKRKKHKKHKHRDEKDGGCLVVVDDSHLDTLETTV